MQSGPVAYGPVPSLLTPTVAAASIQALHVWRRPVSTVAASRDRAAKYLHEGLVMISQIIFTRKLLDHYNDAMLWCGWWKHEFFNVEVSQFAKFGPMMGQPFQEFRSQQISLGKSFSSQTTHLPHFSLHLQKNIYFNYNFDNRFLARVAAQQLVRTCSRFHPSVASVEKLCRQKNSFHSFTTHC